MSTFTLSLVCMIFFLVSMLISFIRENVVNLIWSGTFFLMNVFLLYMDMVKNDIDDLKRGKNNENDEN